MNKLTQHQKIISLMARRKETQEWFYPYDFMPPTLPFDSMYFVGYEASARLSELGTDQPEMIETEQDGKYKKRRIRWETMPQWFSGLPKDLRYALHRTGVTAGLERKPEPAPVIEPPRPATEPTRLFDMPVTPPKRNDWR